MTSSSSAERSGGNDDAVRVTDYLGRPIPVQAFGRPVPGSDDFLQIKARNGVFGRLNNGLEKGGGIDARTQPEPTSREPRRDLVGRIERPPVPLYRHTPPAYLRASSLLYAAREPKS
jgi:hypothetical protein